jgi:type II secretory pathway component PulC
MDISSFLWGAALGVIGALGTGFLKKAGEDGYSWVKKKINPNASEAPKPHLIIHVNSENSSSTTTSSSLLEQVSSVTTDAINNSLESAPPLQRERIASSYIGLRVEWDTEFSNGKQLDNGRIRLHLSALSKTHASIWCDVSAEEYRELSILTKGSKIRIYGEIESVNSHGIDIKNAQLHIYPRTQQ